MTEPFLGEVQIYGFPYAPYGWAFANGATMALRQFTALYSLYGTTFGGDGVTTFALPDLAGRAACGAGTSPGQSNRTIGESFGTTSVTLQQGQMPAHSHTLSDYQPDQPSQLVALPNAGTAIGYSSSETFNAFAAPGAPATMDPNALTASGGGQPHENRQPYLALNYSVALVGNYPLFD